MSKRLIKFGLFILLFSIPVATSAQLNVGSWGSSFGLGTADLVSSVVKIVQWILGFVGLVTVIFILYGGFMWMTAGGNEEKVKKAKQVISAAVIGLIIVTLSWAIIIFVVNTAKNVALF